MKRALLLCLCFLFFCGCASSGGYEKGYAAGYDAGYKAALETRAMPEVSAETTPRLTASPSPTAAPASDDFTVYISRSFTMHKTSTCSGMTESIGMPYSVAREYFDKKCKNCFK